MRRVVVHVHCVETIATAVHADAAAIAEEKLQGIPYAFVPYARPGLPLAKAIAERIRDDTSVLVLGNHGLAVAAETVADAARLLAEVSQRFAVPVRRAPSADLEALSRLAVNSAYRLPDDGRIHDAATDLESCRIAAGGSLYPDHVIFLGKGRLSPLRERTRSLSKRASVARERACRRSFSFPARCLGAQGYLCRARSPWRACLSDVTSRIPRGASCAISPMRKTRNFSAGRGKYPSS